MYTPAIKLNLLFPRPAKAGAALAGREMRIPALKPGEEIFEPGKFNLLLCEQRPRATGKEFKDQLAPVNHRAGYRILKRFFLGGSEVMAKDEIGTSGILDNLGEFFELPLARKEVCTVPAFFESEMREDGKAAARSQPREFSVAARGGRFAAVYRLSRIPPGGDSVSFGIFNSDSGCVCSHSMQLRYIPNLLAGCKKDLSLNAKKIDK
jgi:hypothetical protein